MDRKERIVQREAPDLVDKQTAETYTQKITGAAENLLENIIRRACPAGQALRVMNCTFLTSGPAIYDAFF